MSDTAAEHFWDETSIDGAIGEIARTAAARLDAGYDDLAAAVKSERDRRPHIAAFSTVDELFADREMIRTVLLSDDHPGFRVVRRMLPLDVLVSAEERAEAFRNATLASPLGAHYKERWATPPRPVNGWGDNVVEQLLASLSEDEQRNFARFVSSAAGTKWFIAADFVIAPDRPTDVFAFSLFPYDMDMEQVFAEIRQASPADLKGTKAIPEAMLDYIKSRRRFHFAFVVNKSRHRALVPDVATARTVIDTTLATMLNWKDADNQQNAISAVKALRQRANANNFNIDLFADMILLGVLGGFLGMLLHREGRAEIVGFFPDRDKMTNAYDAVVVKHLMSTNMSAFTDRRKMPHGRTAIGLPAEGANGGTIWFDDLIRVPDFIAGALAGSVLEGERTSSLSPKYAALLSGAIADNDHVLIKKLNIEASGTSASGLLLTKTPSAVPDQS
jgi:hypothetical protein